jgi:phospholipid/cholesterol/gamma-HCH transport system substrate-binding protein
MSAYRRNVAVGLTVLVAMVILGWMILRFGAAPAQLFQPKQYPIRLISERADGLSDGSPVTYRGVGVGRVTNVTRHPTDMTTVYIDAAIDAAPPLPGNVAAVIRTQGLIGGGAAVVLQTTPDGAAPQGKLRPGQELRAIWVGLDILPPEFAELASEFRLTMRQLRESGILDNLNAQITRAGKLMESADTLINDPALRENINTSTANLRQITESAKRISGNLEKFSEDLARLQDETRGAITDARNTIKTTEGRINELATQLTDRVAQTAVLLDQFQSIAGKIDKGQGTAGQLVNDPRLYESLVATTEQLALTIKDLKRLVEQWEQEGVQLKLR